MQVAKVTAIIVLVFCTLIPASVSTARQSNKVGTRLRARLALSSKAKSLESTLGAKEPEEGTEATGKRECPPVITLSSGVNGKVKQLTMGVVGMIPKVGGILKAVLGAFWPEDQPDIWHLIKDQVKRVVKHEILANRIDVYAGRLNGLRNLIRQYTLASGFNERANMLSNIIAQCTMLKHEMITSNERHHFIPAAVAVAELHLAALRERFLFGNELFDHDDSVFWRQGLETAHAEYMIYFRDAWQVWKTWRLNEIVVEEASRDHFKIKDEMTCDEVLARSCTHFCKRTVYPEEIERLRVATLKRMQNQAIAEMADFVVPAFDFVKFLPDATSQTQINIFIPELETLEMGPYSVGTLGVSPYRYSDSTPIETGMMNIDKILVRSAAHVDGFEFLEAGEDPSKNSFVGNFGGGRSEMYQNTPERYCIGFSNMAFQNGILGRFKLAFLNTTTGKIEYSEMHGGNSWRNTGNADAVLQSYKLSGGKFRIGNGPGRSRAPALIYLNFRLASL